LAVAEKEDARWGVEELTASPRIRDSIDRMRTRARDGGGTVARADAIEAQLP
jgi:hypothetical protein